MIPADLDAKYDEWIGPLWHELRAGLWHATGSHRFRCILTTEQIQPSPHTPGDEFRWAPNHTTTCRRINAVSLFDFENADWRWIAENGHRQGDWPTLLNAPCSVPANQWTSIIWIAIDRAKLANLMPAGDVAASIPKSSEELDKYMPKVEVCHIGPVPLAACTNAIAFCEFDYRDFHVMDLHPFDLAELDRLERDWLS
jgi:hypothetical protein